MPVPSITEIIYGAVWVVFCFFVLPFLLDDGAMLRTALWLLS